MIPCEYNETTISKNLYHMYHMADSKKKILSSFIYYTEDEEIKKRNSITKIFVQFIAFLIRDYKKNEIQNLKTTIQTTSSEYLLAVKEQKHFDQTLNRFNSEITVMITNPTGKKIQYIKKSLFDQKIKDFFDRENIEAFESI